MCSSNIFAAMERHSLSSSTAFRRQPLHRTTSWVFGCSNTHASLTTPTTARQPMVYTDTHDGRQKATPALTKVEQIHLRNPVPNKNEAWGQRQPLSYPQGRWRPGAPPELSHHGWCDGSLNEGELSTVYRCLAYINTRRSREQCNAPVRPA